MSRQMGLLMCGCLFLAGCGNGGGIPETKFDPSKIGDAAVKQYDTDGNQALSKQELKACPAILAAFAKYDGNSDGKVDAQEIQARLEPFLQQGINRMAQSCLVTFRGAPLEGATVVLEPEEFMGGTVDPAEGVSDRRGGVNLDCGDGYGSAIGVFKVKVTHPEKKIAAKHNDETIHGLEVDPTLAQAPLPIFEVGR